MHLLLVCCCHCCVFAVTIYFRACLVGASPNRDSFADILQSRECDRKLTCDGAHEQDTRCGLSLVFVPGTSKQSDVCHSMEKTPGPGTFIGKQNYVIRRERDTHAGSIKFLNGPLWPMIVTSTSIIKFQCPYFRYTTM